MAKKIMFSDKFGLTEAVLSGRKTQTRRVFSERLLDKWTDYDDFCNSFGVGDIPITREYFNERKFFLDNSPYKVGEVVAVAQCYCDFYDNVNDIRIFPSGAGWTNKMFVRADLMPHRIRITNVRVERLQDISDEDCFKEGIGISATDNRVGNPFGIPFNYYIGEDKKGYRYSTPREAYAALIDRISGKGVWESNPYVFVYDFELVK